MAKFGDELDYQFGYEDFAWTSILPSTAVFSMKLVPCILSMLFKKWLRNVCLCVKKPRFVFSLPLS